MRERARNAVLQETKPTKRHTTDTHAGRRNFLELGNDQADESGFSIDAFLPGRGGGKTKAGQDPGF
jgi:hypothetical protein